MTNHFDVDSLQQIHGLLRKRQAEMVDLLKQLAQIESPSSDPQAQPPVFAVLERELVALGFRCRRISGDKTGGQMLAVPKDRRRTQPLQLLVGHCDTVWPHGTLERMPVAEKEGRLDGPGTYDMKGGLVQAIFALKALKELDLQPTVQPFVFINSDEEIGSFESRQNLHRLAKIIDRALVLEPSLGKAGKIKTARKGVGRFEIEVIGRSAHAGLDPEKGISAISEMSHVVQKLNELHDPSIGTTINVGTISGGTQANVIPERCRILIDVRVLTVDEGKRIEESIATIQPTLAGSRLEVSGSIRRPPLEQTPRNRVLWEHAKEISGWIGLEIDQATAGGGSDGNWMSQHTATLDGLGAVGDGAHALHEHVIKSEMPNRAALLAGLLLAPARS